MTDYNSDFSMTLEWEPPIYRRRITVSVGSMWYKKTEDHWIALIVIKTKKDRWIAIGTTDSGLYVKTKGQSDELKSWIKITEKTHKEIAHILYGVKIVHKDDPIDEEI